MYYLASSNSDAKAKYGPAFHPFVMDHKLGLFILVDGVVGNTLSQKMIEKMSASIHLFMKRNHSHLESYARLPSYPNRVRASMLMDMAMNQARRAAKSVVAENARAEDNKSSVLASNFPSMTVIVVGQFSALIAFGTSSGVYHVRNNVVRLLSVADAKAPDGVDTDTKATDSDETVEGSRRTDMLDMDIAPGDHFLLASDGLVTDIGNGSRMTDLLKEQTTSAAVAKLVDHASNVAPNHLVSGILIKSLGAPKDPDFSAKLEPLRKLTLFRKLNDPELKKMLSIMKLQSVAIGNTLRAVDDQDRTFFICLAGKLEVSAGKRKVGEINADVDANRFGFLNQWTSGVKIIAVQPAKLLLIPSDSVRRLRDHEPTIANKVFWEVMMNSSLRSRAAQDAHA